jgi:phospholipid/cholesterol/gamma-HCH transport system permease protein
MTTRAAVHNRIGGLPQAAAQWLAGWGRIVHVSAVIGVLALSPSSYARDNRHALASNVVVDTLPMLGWFTLLSSLISLVLIRIVFVTSLSYGLSRYALEMVVRVLVLELIPLTAALFVAVRCTIPNGAEITALRRSGAFDALRRQGIDPLRCEVLPRVLAGVLGVALLAGLSCVVSLLLAYAVVYGFTPWGFAGYTHTVGRVFDPALSAVFAIKTLLFALAVSMIPVASALIDAPPSRSRTTAEVRALVRMFALLLLIEAASLAVNYT